MKLTIQILIITVISIFSAGIVFEIVGYVNEIDKDIESMKIEKFYDENNLLVITGEFNTNKKCIINYSSPSNENLTQETKLNKFFNIKINVTEIGTYKFNVSCCTIANQCTHQNLSFNKN